MSEILIYVGSNCPYCVAAKSLFTKLGKTYTEINLDGDWDLRQKLSDENGGWRTVPMIFINWQIYGWF